MQFAPKRCPSHLGSGPALHRWEMGKKVRCPILFYWWVGIGAYAGAALKGHLSSTLCPGSMWDVYSQDAMGR